ncbi:MAG: hypothetical protein H7Y30_06820 [Pyrinomonadaceae bacterium]|nr:hypothetical protein [Pyrinomonadaceae bacterium]
MGTLSIHQHQSLRSWRQILSGINSVACYAGSNHVWQRHAPCSRMGLHAVACYAGSLSGLTFN